MTDSWSEMAPLGLTHVGFAISSDLYVTGVVGDGFAVWGGDDDFSPLLHHIYSPASDTRAPISLEALRNPETTSRERGDERGRPAIPAGDGEDDTLVDELACP